MRAWEDVMVTAKTQTMTRPAKKRTSRAYGSKHNPVNSCALASRSLLLQAVYPLSEKKVDRLELTDCIARKHDKTSLKNGKLQSDDWLPTQFYGGQVSVH